MKGIPTLRPGATALVDIFLEISEAEFASLDLSGHHAARRSRRTKNPARSLSETRAEAGQRRICRQFPSLPFRSLEARPAFIGCVGR